MPNVRYSSGAIGTMRLPISGSFIQSLSSRTDAIVVAILFLPEPCLSSAYTSSPGSLSGLARTTRRGTRAAERAGGARSCTRSRGRPCRGGRTARRRSPRRSRSRSRSRDRQVEPVAELLEVVRGQLLHLVGGVLALEGVDRPALDGLGQDHGRLADVLGGGVERGVHLAVVVAAARQLHGSGRRSCARPSCAAAGRRRRSARGCRRRPRSSRSGTAPSGVVFIWLTRTPSTSRASSGVPLAAPDDLDDVPAGAAEVRLQLLDDLAVAARPGRRAAAGCS